MLRRYDIRSAADVEVKEVPAGTYFLVLCHPATQNVAYHCKVIVIDQK